MTDLYDNSEMYINIYGILCEGNHKKVEDNIQRVGDLIEKIYPKKVEPLPGAEAVASARDQMIKKIWELERIVLRQVLRDYFGHDPNDDDYSLLQKRWNNGTSYDLFVRINLSERTEYVELGKVFFNYPGSKGEWFNAPVESLYSDTNISVKFEPKIPNK